MASPSAGMSKEEIKKRLAEMQKQYAHMQKKLQKSDKAARVRRHVTKKIADYKQRQAADGSPECTISRGSEIPHCTTESPSVFVDNRGRLSSERTGSKSKEKSGKRRSVSFAVSSQTTPTSSRCDIFQEIKFCHEQPIDVGKGVNETPPLSNQQGKEVDRTLKDNADGPNRKLFRSDKQKKQADTMVSSDDQTREDIERSEATVRLVSRQRVSGEIDEEAVPESTIRFKNSRVGEKVKSNSHLGVKNQHRNDSPEMQEILSSPEAKTPPEDTQFDLFADTDVQDESSLVVDSHPDSFEVLEKVSQGKVSKPVVSTSNSSAVRSNFNSTSHAKWEPLQDPSSDFGLQSSRKIEEDSVIILDETQEDIVHSDSQTPKKSSQDILCHIESAERVVGSNISTAYTLKSEQAVKESKPDFTGSKSLSISGNIPKEKYNSHQESISSGECSDDPDVIPSTFPDDLEPVAMTSSNVSSKNSNLGDSYLNTQSAKSQDSSHASGKQVKELQIVSNLKDIKVPKLYDGRRINVLKEDKDTIQGENIMPAQTVETIKPAQTLETAVLAQTTMTAMAAQTVHGQDTECIYGRSGSHQGKDLNSVMIDSQDVINAQESTIKMVPKSPEVKGKIETQKRRQKVQRNIDNLTVDDVSLKEFVVSQQNSQEGSHTWIDGLMYPAEYYVRKTRSMSRPSPNQHSAPLFGQKRSSGSSRRKGPKPRSCLGDTLSEPVVCATSMNEEIAQSQSNMPKVNGSGIVELDEASMCSYVEDSEGSVHGQHSKVTETVPEKSSQPRKMRVLRKPHTKKRRRGRKPASKKQPVEPEQEVEMPKSPCASAQIGTNCEFNRQEMCKNSDQNANSRDGEDQKKMHFVGDCGDSAPNLGNLHEYNQLHSRGEEGIGSSHHEMIGLDLDENPCAENIEQVVSGRTCEKNQHVSITQVTLNPLESQFTQTQVPSNFALPRVFGSPERHTQGLIGLSPGSPIPLDTDAPRSLTTLPIPQENGGMGPAPSQKYGEFNKQNQEDHGDQWMSEVYLADVVPELPSEVNNDNQDSDNLEDDHGRPSSQDVANTDRSDIPIMPEMYPNVKCCDSNIPVINTTQVIDNRVMDAAAILDPEECIPAEVPTSLPSPRAVLEENSSFVPAVTSSFMQSPRGHTKENGPSTSDDDTIADQLVNEEHSFDRVPSSAPAIPSSIFSNVTQGSPMADVATGTPPEVAEVPQAQSQCTDSYKDGTESNRSPKKEIIEGDLSMKDCFLFKGCLQHKAEHSLKAQQIVSRRMNTDDAVEALIAVVFRHSLTFWVRQAGEAGEDYQALCSWRTDELSEEITLFELVPGVTDGVEAVVAVTGGERSHSVRFIRWDYTKARWEKYTVLAPEDIPQSICTSISIVHDRTVAIALYKEGNGSELLIANLGSSDSESKGTPLVTLPALKDRLNSLTSVEGADHMLLGMTDSRALLWHIQLQQLVQVFCLQDQMVTSCVKATAESGLLSLVAYQHEVKEETDKPSCSLLVLNPLNGRSSKLLGYSAPSIRPGDQICDVSLYKNSMLAVSLSSGFICIWDLFSSKLMMEKHVGADNGSNVICLHDDQTLMLGADGCVNIYERNF